MSKLKDAILTEITELDALRGQLEAEKITLAQVRKELYDEEKRIDQKREKAEKSLEVAGGIEEVKRLADDLKGKIEEAEKGLIQIKLKKIELAKWENRLVEIETNQEKERTENAEKLLALNDEKQNYKEKLKAEFLEELKKRLPQ